MNFKSDAANYILTKVIEDSECQKIIMGNGEYYRPIIAEANEHASDLKAKIISIISANPDSDFTKYLLGIVEIISNSEEGVNEEK